MQYHILQSSMLRHQRQRQHRPRQQRWPQVGPRHHAFLESVRSIRNGRDGSMDEVRNLQNQTGFFKKISRYKRFLYSPYPKP